MLSHLACPNHPWHSIQEQLGKGLVGRKWQKCWDRVLTVALKCDMDIIHKLYNPLKRLLRFLLCNNHIFLKIFQEFDKFTLRLFKSCLIFFELMERLLCTLRSILPIILSLEIEAFISTIRAPKQTESHTNPNSPAENQQAWPLSATQPNFLSFI